MIEWLTKYKLRAYLQADIITGFTVGIMNIPQGMGYAMLASLPPVGGLYISFFPVLIYGIFGTSRHLAIGSIAIVSLLTGSVVNNMMITNGTQITDTDALNEYKFKVACSLSLLVGILQVQILHKQKILILILSYIFVFLVFLVSNGNFWSWYFVLLL